MEERIVGPDPVEDPEGYQQALLDLLGDEEALDVLASTPEKIEDLCADLDIGVLQKEPEPGEWSAEGVLAHLLDAEIVYAFRNRMMLAQTGSHFPAYNQDLWIDLAHPSFPEMLSAFSSLRRLNVWLAEETPSSEWASKGGVHSERGEMSYDLALKTVAGHDLAHLKQLEKTLAAVQA